MSRRLRISRLTRHVKYYREISIIACFELLVLRVSLYESYVKSGSEESLMAAPGRLPSPQWSRAGTRSRLRREEGTGLPRSRHKKAAAYIVRCRRRRPSTPKTGGSAADPPVGVPGT